MDFIKITVDLSGAENGKYLEYLHDGEKRMPYRRVRLQNGDPYAYLECVFSYEIGDPNTVTIGERDFTVESTAEEIENYFFGLSKKDLSNITEEEAEKELNRIVSGCSTGNIKLFLDSVFFDKEEQN